MVGNPVKFVYVATGGSIPGELQNDADTIYFLEDTREIKVGSLVLANVDDNVVTPEALAELLEAYTIKSIQVIGTGETVNNVAFDATSGKITVSKGSFPSISKGAAPAPTTETLLPGGTFEAVINTSVSGHTITDNIKKFTLPEYIGEQGITVDGSTIKLPQAFYDYLVKQTFATPTIDTFTVTGLGSAAEIGTSVSITGITHKEDNPENIEGTLTLRRGSTVVKSDILPSSTSTDVALDSAISVTRTTAGSETFTISGLDKLGETFTKSVSKSFYVPKFLGSSASASVTASDILSMTKGQMLPTTITNSSIAYIYFVTDEPISSVKDAYTGFSVPIEEAVTTSVTINSVPVSYYVYRTSNRIQAGTYHFTIA